MIMSIVMMAMTGKAMGIFIYNEKEKKKSKRSPLLEKKCYNSGDL
jgi:hypothetical protein